MSIRLTLSAVAMGVAAFLSGCTAIPAMDYEPGKNVTSEASAKNVAKTAGWEDVPVLTEGVSSMVLLTPMSPPDSVKNRKVDLEMEPGATVADLVAILGRIGVTAIISDEAVAGRQFYLPKYKGSLGGLLSAVTRATDTWFVWHDGTLVVSATEKIGVSVPQEVDFAEELTKGLTGLGVTGSSVSWQAGMAVMDLAPGQFTKVRTYLERFTSNAAVVTMQMAVVTVTLNQSSKQGIDWTQLSLAAQPQGTAADLATWRAAATGSGSTTTGTTTTGTTTTGTTTGSTTTGTVADAGTTGATTSASTVTSAAAATTGSSGSLAAGVADAITASANAATSLVTAVGPAAATALTLSSSGLSAAVFMDKFSFSGLFGFLQTYGTTETKQNVMLKTVTGSKVEFKSVTEIPYVSSVGVTTSGTTSSTTTGSTETATATDGITVQLTPAYDAAANSVTVDFNLSIQSVLAFNELSAGNQIGTLTQPTTAERSFTDKLRVRPGQTVVVGGLTYDSVSDTRGSPLYLQKTALESQTLKVERHTTFIVLRPTVTRLGQVLASEAGQSLDLLPSAAEPAPEPEPAARKTSAKGSKK